MLFQIPDSIWNALIAAVMTAIITWLNKRNSKKVAGEVETVRETLESTNKKTDTKLNNLADVAQSTHVLVNSNMGIQLKLNAELSRWKANQTGKPEDAKAADLAERLVEEHAVKQNQADAKN